MNENKTIVTNLDFKLSGEKELTKFFQNMGQFFDTEKLKTEGNNAHALVLTAVRNIKNAMENGLDIDMNKMGILKAMRALSSLLDKLQGDVIQASASDAIAAIDKKLDAAQARVEKAMESVKKIDKEIAEKRSDLSKRMSDGSFGQVFTEDLKEADEVIKQLEAVREEMNKLQEEGKDITGLKKQEEALIRLAQAIQEINKDIAKLGKSRGGHNSQKTQGENALKKLTTEKKNIIAASPSEINDQTKAYQKLFEVLEFLRELNLAESVKTETKEREKNNEETKKAAAENEKLNKSVKKGEKTWGRKVFEMFAYQNVLRQIKRIWTTSIQVITELDRAMVEAAIVTNMTTKETWKLLGSYQELADIVGRSTSEIASLNAFFLQQGLTVKNAMQMTEVAAKSAAIAGISLQESANYLTSAINGFGLAASAAEEVADKFAAVGAATAADFEELAIAMSKVAPVAQSAGVGIDFMMGVLAKGIHTTREAPENIGTAFKTIFARMSELTDMGKAMEDGMSLNRVEKALESVGISLRSQTGQFRDLEDVLYEVGYAWKDLDSLQQNYLATALAGTRQQPRLMAILNDFEETVEFINISKDSAQAMEFQHMEYMTGMEAASQSVRNAWEKVVTSFVNSDVVITVLKSLATVVNGLAKTINFLNNGIVKVVLAAGLMGVAFVLTKKILSGLRVSIITTALATKGLTAEEIKAAIATTTLSGAFKMLGGAVNIALGSLGWAIIILTSLATVGKSVYDRFKEATLSVEEANKAIYESKQRDQGLQNTIDRFEELQKKIGKTNEELEEMIELQKQLEAFDSADGSQINFISEDEYGNQSVDQDKVIENRVKEQIIRANANGDILKQINDASADIKRYSSEIKKNEAKIAKYEEQILQFGYLTDESDRTDYGKIKADLDTAEKNLKNSSQDLEKKFSKEFLKAGREAGIQFGEGLLANGNITPQQVSEYEKTVGRIMGTVDFSKFLKSDGTADIKLAKEMGKKIGEAVGDAFEAVKDIDKLDIGVERALTDKMEAYQKMIEQLESMGFSSKEMHEIKIQLGFEFADEQVLDLLTKKNINMGVIATFLDKGGKLSELHGVLDKLGQFSEKELTMEDWNNQEDRRGKINDRLKEIADNEAKQEKRIEDKEWKGITKLFVTKKKVEREVDDILKQGEKEREELMEELGEMYTIEEIALSQLSSQSIEKLINRTDIQGAVDEVRDLLLASGKDLAEVNQYIESNITSKLGIKNAEQIADAGANIGNVMTKALKVGEEMAAGDFTGYLELIREFSQEAVDEFLKNGNVSGLVDESTEKMLEDIEDQRELLRSKINTEEQIEAALMEKRKEGYSEEQIKAYEKMLRDRNATIRGELKALDIMEGAMDSINYKLQVYDALTKSAADNLSKANGFLSDIEALLDAGFDEDSSIIGLLKGLEDEYRTDGLEDAFNNLANIQEEIEEGRKDLIERKLMGEDGKMIYNDDGEGKEYQDAFLLLLEKAADAAKNVTGEILRKISVNNKEYAQKIKESNETYKNLIDSMNKIHKTRWDEVDYENKLIDLQKNIYDARNKLSAAQVGGTQKQMQDAQEELRRMQQERRKAIEDESIKRLEEDLEKQRKEAEDKLEAKKMEQNKLLIDNIGDLNKTLIESNELAKTEVKEDKKTTDKPKTPRPPSGGGGKGNQISLEKRMI